MNTITIADELIQKVQQNKDGIIPSSIDVVPPPTISHKISDQVN